MPTIPSTENLSVARASTPVDPYEVIRGLLDSSPSAKSNGSSKSQNKASSDKPSSALASSVPDQTNTAELFKKLLIAGTGKLMLSFMEQGATAQDLAPRVNNMVQAIDSVGQQPVAVKPPDMVGTMPITIDKAVQRNLADKVQAQPKPQETVPSKPQEQQNINYVPARSMFDTGGLHKNKLTGADEFSDKGDLVKILEFLARGSFGEGSSEAVNIQKARGQEPLQKGKREELGMTYARDIALKKLEVVSKLSEAGNLKPEHIFNKFEAASVPFITARDAHARVEASAKDPTGAGDLALLYNYMKVLDPGSTVRESEFQTASQAGSYLQRVYGQTIKFTTGGSLAPEVRADFVSRSRRLLKSMEAQQKKTTSEFKRLAEKNGINFENIIRDTGLASEESNAPKVGTVENGYRFKGGNPASRNSWEKVK